jgi:hypothetical protein
MVTVTGLSAQRMLEIEAASVVGGSIVSDNLVLTRHDGGTIVAGNVRGNPGVPGPPGGYFNDITVESLPATGIISAHRTGGGGGAATATVPEETMIGAWASIALGAHILDIDCQLTADGSYAIMHDDTVDRTTVGTGAVNTYYVSNLPPINPAETSGAGWGDLLQAPTLAEFLQAFGGKTVITIEAKGGIPSVAPLATIIKARGLAKSVFINTTDPDVVPEIVAQGCLAHLWAWSDPTKVAPGIANGASLIEIPWNADPSLVAQCQAARADSSKKLRWFIAGPTGKRSEVSGMTPGIMGHVTDLIGHTNRKSGDAPLVTSILPSLLAGKRGIGWKLSVAGGSPQGALNMQPNKGMAWSTVTGSTAAGLYLGDMSGTMPSSYTLAMKFIPDSTFVDNASANVRFRFASTLADASGQDSDSNGYVVILNGNGRLRLYVAGNTTADPAILLYENAQAATFTAGQEYRLATSVTPSSVAISASGTGISKASGGVANTTYRGGHIYIWRVGTTNPNTFITDFTRS